MVGLRVVFQKIQQRGKFSSTTRLRFNDGGEIEELLVVFDQAKSAKVIKIENLKETEESNPLNSPQAFFCKPTLIS